MGSSAVGKHYWKLYVLKLQDDKYYVGITSKTPEERMQEHLKGVRAAYWTARHKPLALIYREDLGYIEKAKAEKRENKYVREIMKKKGVNNVRGGDLTDTYDYTVRFGWIYDKEGWKDVVYATVILIVLVIFSIDKYMVPFLPGGVR